MMVSTKSARVYVCDDETPVRISVQYYLERYEWLSLVGSGATPEECIDAIETLQPDIATVDIFMRSKRDGLRTCEGIARVSPDTQMIAYSAFFDRTLTSTLSGLGVVGFVDKGNDMCILADAMLAVLDGDMYSCPTVTERLAKWSISNDSQEDVVMAAPLSPGQINVLNLIVQGFTSDEIACQLEVEPCTVRTQRRRLMQKFDAHNVAQLIEAAIRHGYLR